MIVSEKGRLPLLSGFLLLTALSLSACSGLFGPGEPPGRIQLNPALPSDVHGTDITRKTQIIIATPRAPADIDNDRIALLFNQRELRGLAGYRWSTPAPFLIKQSLIDSLQATNAFASVTDESLGITSPLVMTCDLQQFNLSYDVNAGDQDKQPPVAVLQATFRLVDQQKGKVVTTLPVLKKMQASSTQVPDLMNAMESVLTQTINTTGVWLVNSLPQPTRKKR